MDDILILCLRFASDHDNKYSIFPRANLRTTSDNVILAGGVADVGPVLAVLTRKLSGKVSSTSSRLTAFWTKMSLGLLGSGHSFVVIWVLSLISFAICLRTYGRTNDQGNAEIVYHKNGVNTTT